MGRPLNQGRVRVDRGSLTRLRLGRARASQCNMTYMALLWSIPKTLFSGKRPKHGRYQAVLSRHEEGCLALIFQPSAIDKYDRFTNLAEWLEVYHLAIESAGGDSYIMPNYLPICLSSSVRT
jgi:hypothetical protein